MLLSEQARALLEVTRVFGDLDMSFSRNLSPKTRTRIEDLVLKWHNQAVKTGLVLNRDRCNFDGGWTSDDRFETIDCPIAEVLCASGDAQPLLNFLVDIDLVAPLEQVWVCVEAPLRWFVNWHEELDGEFGHSTEPAYVTFKRIPDKAKRQKIELVFGFEEAGTDDMFGDEGFWDSDDTFTIGVLEECEDSDMLLEQLVRVSKIIPVKVAGIGVIVNL